MVFNIEVKLMCCKHYHTEILRLDSINKDNLHFVLMGMKKINYDIDHDTYPYHITISGKLYTDIDDIDID